MALISNLAGSPMYPNKKRYINPIFGQGLALDAKGGLVKKNSTPNTAPVASTPASRTPAQQQQATTAPVPTAQLLNDIKARATQLQGIQPKPVKGVVSPQTPVMPKYASIVQGLVDASKPQKNQTKAVKEIQQLAQGAIPIGDKAAAISQQYGSEIARIGELGAGAQAGALSTGTDVVGKGLAAIASQSTSQRMNALATAQQAALQGTQQQLSAQEAATAGMTGTLPTLTAQQQLQQQGLTSAASLAQPSPTSFGQTVFNPLTGQFEGGGGLDPQSQAQQLAQQVASGAISYDQALSSLGYAGSVGSNFLNSALTSMGANPLQLQAQGSAQQANIGTQTTTPYTIAQQGLTQATQDYVALNTQAQYAGQQASALTSILDKTGLNNTQSTDYNKVLNNLQKRFSSTDFAALQTALIEARNAYSQLLSMGGITPTGSEASALATLDINQSAAAITSSVKQLEAAVARRLQAQSGAVQTYQQNLFKSGGSSSVGGGTRIDSWDQI